VKVNNLISYTITSCKTSRAPNDHNNNVCGQPEWFTVNISEDTIRCSSRCVLQHITE